MKNVNLEEKLKPFENPVSHPFAKWLYLHFPPRPLLNKKIYDRYLRAVEILLEEMESKNLKKPIRNIIVEYVQSVTPFLETYEKKEFPFKSAEPEEVLRFLMEQNHLSQYDLAADFGGQPVVSEVLNKKRKMTREQIQRLSKRFRISPASFFSETLFEPSRVNESEAEYHAKLKKAFRKRNKK